MKDDIGRRGEQIALQHLLSKGYTLEVCNYHCPFGEIDLIVWDEEYLVFVEVKTRETDRYGLPQEFVSNAKIRRLRRTAEDYLMRHPDCRLQPRFDVVAVIAPHGGHAPVQIEHIENAF